MDYGIQIYNFQSGALYSYNLGTRDFLEHKKGVVSNSLFLDFLKDNGLNIYKEKSTRDIICIDFTFGTRSYAEELAHIEQSKKDWKNSYNKGRITLEAYNTKISKIDKILERVKTQEDKYIKMSKEDIRIEWYTKGVGINYTDKDSDGNITKSEYIHYRMLWRTPGKAKKGSCMFIRDELYEAAHNFLYMGITLPEHKTPIVEMGAYSALITSSIVGKVQIKPEELLVIKDIDSFYHTKAICIETNKLKECVVSHKDDYEVCNVMFDGQALIDTSIFPNWADGYILLRHHMCKAAAFHTNIQKYFKDYFGDKYDTATVTDMYGNILLAKNIKLITTENAMKWKTFGVSYDYWLEWIGKNDYNFGIVKTAHESKYGNIQQMSYQMINALDMDIMDEVLDCSRMYINKLKNNDQFFMNYLEDKKNFSNDFEVLLALCKHNDNFLKTDYCKERRRTIIKSIIMQLRVGKVLQEGDNLVLVGSPYAMLLHSVGEDVSKDKTFYEEEAIQCYTERFQPNEYLAGFRSPFNSKNNLDYLHNVDAWEFHQYFNLGRQVIAVNVQGTDFEDRNNGSDFDSDSLFVTNHRAIVQHAKRCYKDYPTIVNCIPKEKNIYDNTLENFAIIDNTLASYQRAIGESSNLAQVAQTYSYNYDNPKLDDYACVLAVIAQIAIDSAKRKFDVNILDEIARIRRDMDVQTIGYPVFYADVQNKKYVGVNLRNKYKDPKKFKIDKINFELKCPMNCVREVNVRKDNDPVISFTDMFIPHELHDNDRRRKSRKVEKLIEQYSLRIKDTHQYERTEDEYSEVVDEWLICQEDFESLIQEIREIKLSHNYVGLMYWLICRAFTTPNTSHSKFQTQLHKNRPVLLRVLYEVNPKAFLECFEKSNGV